MTGRPSEPPPAPDEFERTPTNPSMRRDVTPLPDVLPQAPAPTDGQLVVKEFSLGGMVPRIDPDTDRRATQDVYVRLENTIYGPLSSEELAAMLASGQFTGYESASSDLQHWTPLLYHPRMNLTGYADPDQTHALLHGRSTLPAASRPGTRVRLEDFADADMTPPAEPGVPLAAIMLKPRRMERRTTRGVELPVFAEITEPDPFDDAEPSMPRLGPLEDDAPASPPPVATAEPVITEDSGLFVPSPRVPTGEVPAAVPAWSEDRAALPDPTDEPVAEAAPVDAPAPPVAAPPVVAKPATAESTGFSTMQVTVVAIIVATTVVLTYWFVFRPQG